METCSKNTELDVVPEDYIEEVAEIPAMDAMDGIGQCINDFYRDICAVLQITSNELKQLEVTQDCINQEINDDINETQSDLQRIVMAHSQAVDFIKGLQSCLVVSNPVQDK